jgi:hypothetical protein
MGNGALPHGPSYHAHPRLYRKSVPKPMLNIPVTNAALQYQQVVTAFETLGTRSTANPCTIISHFQCSGETR